MDAPKEHPRRRDPWVRWSACGVGGFALVSLFLGFVLLPSVQPDFTARGLWDGICRAAGVPSNWTSAATSKPARNGTTLVVLGPEMASARGRDSIGRGATIAVQLCSMCHGAQGMSEANAPNLSGQYPEVVIKQLHDFQRGARTSAIMQSLAHGLSDRDIDDLAAYYGSLPKARARPVLAGEQGAPALVKVGDPLRNIVPCVSCHGGIDHKLGTPRLEGMPKVYLLEQLHAFKRGERRNDSFAQMRNMVRVMSPEEIEVVAEFYAGRPAGSPAEQ
ncbi:c-type cytochrome [Variovorax sp. J2P1-59]|uniref:c-type cytochrome n=1 Tax=Variovorax flavidus TaxID=3053501 RepID=UPI0025776AB8|nr:c-type cytochrome [Variovorax sp. J2P1-59]MDM0074085.1 c-type cytochrome [Variovorax sp. J2P1-59]